MNFRTVREL